MRNSIVALGALVAAAWAAPALAGGAFCTPDWRPENPDLACSSQIAISPGNDSRVNIFLLLQDRAGQNGAGLDYPDLDWEGFLGRNFLRWQHLRAAWFPPRQLSEDEGGDGWSIYGGDRCQTIDSGRVVFLEALGRAGGIGDATRTLLKGSRDNLAASCADGPGSVKREDDSAYFVNIGTASMPDVATGYMAYLEGSASFYGGEWERADHHYTQLQRANLDPWLTETASYMIARNQLNRAIETAEDEWSWFDVDDVEASIAKQSEAGFRAYLAAYPDGRYADSARGLIRKALWLQREYEALGTIYGELLQDADPNAETTARLIEEVDDKWIIRGGRPAPTDALLLAADDLMRMRSWQYDEELSGLGARGLTAEELDAQAPVFADHPELFSFLKANHAFYVAGDYRAVRDLLPDDARQESFTPLAFSRQYLRGLALHALGDRNEEGFWLELIGGAKGLYQRPAVELALARLYEQQGQLDKVFAQVSPIADARIRRILLGASAGPDILKQQARATDAPAGEAAFALFAALFKQLQHGEYAGFNADYPLAAQYEPDEDQYGLWGVYDAEVPPLDLFTKGEWSDGYACPSLAQTVEALARNPRAVDARLCLGDFYRLNGFDNFSLHERYEQEGNLPPQLGDKSYYPGTIIPRHDFYTSIMADSSTSRSQRAYALYRAIRCYAPANMNTCGGKGVEESQREAWYKTLKRDYGATQWAQELKYYW